MLVTLADAAQTVQISQSDTNVLRQRFVLDCVIAVLLNGVNSPREKKLAKRMIRTPIMGPDLFLSIRPSPAFGSTTCDTLAQRRIACNDENSQRTLTWDVAIGKDDTIKLMEWDTGPDIERCAGISLKNSNPLNTRKSPLRAPTRSAK